MDYRKLKAPRVLQRGPRVPDDARRVLRLRRHGRHLHVEMAAVHVDGDDGRLGGLELELAIKAGNEGRTIDDLDLAHDVSLSGKIGTVPVYRVSARRRRAASTGAPC